MRYFTSDHHFGHANIIRYCDRPYASLDEMNAALIDGWNSTITNADEVYVLGDFALTPLARIAEILACLNGHAKHLIMGNHDRHKAPHYLQAGFTTACKGQVAWSRHKLEGKSIPLYLQHHPHRPELCRQHEHWILCGHVHQHWTIRRDIKCLNVGVDVHGFKPISEERVIELIENSHPMIIREAR